MMAHTKTDRDRLLDIGFKVLDDFFDGTCPHCEADDCEIYDPAGPQSFTCGTTGQRIPADDDYRHIAGLLLDAWGVEG